MKNIIRIFILPVIFLCLISNSNAQRSRQFRGETGRMSPAPDRSSSQRHMETRQAPMRTFNSSRQSQPLARTNPERTFNNNANRTVTPRTINSRTTNNYNERNIVSRDNYNNRIRTYDQGVRTYNYRSYPTSHYYGNVYGRRTYFMAGPRYTMIPRSFISLHFGGHPYYYNRGYFYGYYGGYYQPIFPPFGLQLSILPFGYSTIFIGSIPYYYYNGIYYRHYSNYYQVVDAPMGAIVSSVPAGARSVIINGEQFYELNGTYYKAETDTNGSTIYEVVGKNGVVNNTAGNESDNLSDNTINNGSSLQIGDFINQLPEGSKIITLNGQQLYETPDNIYLQKEENDGVIQYKVVGK